MDATLPSKTTFHAFPTLDFNAMSSAMARLDTRARIFFQILPSDLKSLIGKSSWRPYHPAIIGVKPRPLQGAGLHASQVLDHILHAVRYAEMHSDLCSPFHEMFEIDDAIKRQMADSKLEKQAWTRVAHLPYRKRRRHFWEWLETRTREREVRTKHGREWNYLSAFEAPNSAWKTSPDSTAEFADCASAVMDAANLFDRLYRQKTLPHKHYKRATAEEANDSLPHIVTEAWAIYLKANGMSFPRQGEGKGRLDFRNSFTKKLAHLRKQFPPG